MLWLLWEGPGAFLDQMGYIISPENSGSVPGSPPCWMCSEILKTEVPRRRANQMPKPPQVAPLKKMEQKLHGPQPVSEAELHGPQPVSEVG